jgi:hypothetical protein
MHSPMWYRACITRPPWGTWILAFWDRTFGVVCFGDLRATFDQIAGVMESSVARRETLELGRKVVPATTPETVDRSVSRGSFQDGCALPILGRTVHVACLLDRSLLHAVPRQATMGWGGAGKNSWNNSGGGKGYQSYGNEPTEGTEAAKKSRGASCTRSARS